jgi:hypothetical protein
MKKFWCKHHGKKEMKNCHCNSCGGGAYFLGFLGAFIYYAQQSTTFWQGVTGFLKALIWPAFLVYKLFG